MPIIHFVGIDVSKKTLDISVVTDGQIKSHCQVLNTKKAIQSTVPAMMNKLQATMENTVFCLEHTGMYTMILLRWLTENGAKVWLESPVRISAGAGIVRGKNDKVDSGRIALYAFKNYHCVKLWKAPRPVLEKLAALLSQRTRLIKAKRQLSVAFNEQKKFYQKDVLQTLQQFVDNPIKAIEEQVVAIEKEIRKTIKEDLNLYKLYKILVSINGIGLQTAAYVLVTTNEFLTITDAKKYACYSGVAPFEYSSGTSIRKRSRVSPKANKIAKTLLHLSALNAVRSKGDIQDYYHRKIEEGKNKMSILNAVRNKLIHRIFTCVKQDRLFEKNYSYKKVA
jgi:transposase